MNDSTIHDLANELDRLCPSQVDRTPHGNGQHEAGHVGHDNGDEWPSVGWFCAGGNVGNSVFGVHPADVRKAVKRLSKMADGALDDDGLKEALDGLRIEWHV